MRCWLLVGIINVDEAMKHKQRMPFDLVVKCRVPPQRSLPYNVWKEGLPVPFGREHPRQHLRTPTQEDVYLHP